MSVPDETPTTSSATTKRDIVRMIIKINSFKKRVEKFLKDTYEDFVPTNTTVYAFIEEGKILDKETLEMLKSLEWTQSDPELSADVHKLKEAEWDVDVINRVLIADEIFQCIEEGFATNEYMVVLDMLKKLKFMMHSNAAPEVQQILLSHPCYDSIRVRYLLQLTLVKKYLKEKFERLLQYSEKLLPYGVCATIQVSRDVPQLQDTIIALLHAQYDLAALSDFLMDKCLTPIICKSVNMSLLEESSEHHKLQITYAVAVTSRPDYKQVFENIRLLFHCLENLNVLFTPSHHVFCVIGQRIKDRFLKLLIDECLMEAIPETYEDYQKCSLVEDVLQFEHFLADLFLINKEVEHTLTKFTERFETLFRNRNFRSILENGREIMRKDLMDMAPLAEKNTPEDVANNPLLFPKCMVSKSVLEFVKLLNRIQRQDGENPNEDSRYLGIITVLLNSYMNLVPEFHKEALESLPQMAMLLYNNCLFLHHWAAKKFDIPTVANLVKNLLATGTKYLKKQIAKQLTILGNILNVNNTSGNHLISTIVVRKCLIHLRLLESLWQTVVPLNVYSKTMGELVSSCCCKLTQNIITRETLDAVERKQMVEAMQLFKYQAGNLFKDQKELLSLNDWQRLINLIKILKATLPQIAEMWSSAKLSEYFKPEEVTRLIRSIHPNTEKRALALKKIF